MILALRRQKQVDLCELETSPVYRASFSTASATQKPCLETPCPKKEWKENKKRVSWSDTSQRISLLQ